MKTLRALAALMSWVKSYSACRVRDSSCSSFPWRIRPRPRKMYAESTPANTKAEMAVTIITSKSEKPRNREACGLRSLICGGESILADIGSASAGVRVARHTSPTNGESYLQ